MKRGVALLGLVLVLLGVFAVLSSAQEKPSAAEETKPAAEEKKPTFKYVGGSKCKMCHKTEAQGKQYGIWASNPHAKAYKTLATDQSKEIAGKYKDMKDPQKDARCLKCHVTAFGVDAKLIKASFKMEDGVQCEACHGPGSKYKSPKVMKALSKGTQDPAEVGYIASDEKLCVTCHNKESPTYKPFKFEEAYKKIAHPIPKKATK